ncbi:bifunctional protein GlmU-like [Bacillus rossius redtenbacheri]|uniref:bifunctional protein GlmU-like n=1 Tax=Bacillus rossius redtenbacheri TaxID=93214 RepID=UPI002FDE1F64
MEAVRSGVVVYPMRLLPGAEIKSSLIEFVKENRLEAAFVVTCCGSLTKATLRFATCENGEHTVRTLQQCFEIVSLVGTVCRDGAHLHATLGTSDGTTVSGHVVGDLVVQTTAEIVLGVAEGARFNRVFDPSTKFSELVVTQKS